MLSLESVYSIVHEVLTVGARWLKQILHQEYLPVLPECTFMLVIDEKCILILQYPILYEQ